MASKDTRLLVAGVVAFLALVVYLSVAFVTTHASSFGTVSNLSSKVAPWSQSASNFAAVPRGGGAFAVVVTPAAKSPTQQAYGAVAQTILPDPTPGGTYLVELGLRGLRPGRIAVELNEFRPGVARYPLQTTVPATRKWHTFSFKLRVKGRWLGLAMYVYRLDTRRPTWFALRGLDVVLLRK